MFNVARTRKQRLGGFPALRAGVPAFTTLNCYYSFQPSLGSRDSVSPMRQLNQSRRMKPFSWADELRLWGLVSKGTEEAVKGTKQVKDFRLEPRNEVYPESEP